MGNIFSLQIACDDAILSRCLDCTFRKTAYISELEDNLVALQTEIQKLVEARSDVMVRVTVAEQQQMKRLTRVQGWLSRVEAVETEVDELIKDSSQEIQKLCLGGYCSKKCKSSYKFGKKVAKTLQVLATLMVEGAFDVVAERVPRAAVHERPSQPTIGLESTFEKVWSCLQEEQVGIIGLYGMGGVGKTTLLTHINNNFVHTPNNFVVVIWVAVSKDVQYEKIQENIAKMIGLIDELWKNKSLEEKAIDIFNILSKKMFVLLLDDIWERVDLCKVGVPLPNPKNASKVVFTTRFSKVCGHMDAQKKFKVESLADEEAWKLFKTRVGEEALGNHPDVPTLAKAVAKECNGLPLALITIGRAMAKNTPEEWKYAIQVLRRSAFEFPGMGKDVYTLLKFSYDSLPNNTIKSCFLYFSLFPEDYIFSKTRLIDYWTSEGFLNGKDRSESEIQGYYIIGVLIHACCWKKKEHFV